MAPADRTADGPVRAAGGVVWRRRGGAVEVAVVHRPRYDDWSLPKGKLDPGEHPLTAAVREVAEEADVRGVPQVRLAPVRYLMRDGVPKLVEFWSMRAAEAGGFEPGTEVDDVRWLPCDEAAGLVSYPHDVRVLRDFAALPPVTAVLAVVGCARRRGTWAEPESTRPLGADGWAQARTLAGLLALVRPVRLLSAVPVWYAQTLRPLAELLDRPVEVDPVFGDPQPGQDPAERALAAADGLRRLAGTGTSAVVCGPEALVAPALAHLVGVRGTRRRVGATPRRDGPPGDGIGPDRPGRDEPTRPPQPTLLAFAGDRLVGVSRLDLADGR